MFWWFLFLWLVFFVIVAIFVLLPLCLVVNVDIVWFISSCCSVCLLDFCLFFVSFAQAGTIRF